MKASDKTKIKNLLSIRINSVTDDKGNYLPIDIFVDIDSYTDMVENWVKNTLGISYKKEYGTQIRIKINHQATLHINTLWRQTK